MISKRPWKLVPLAAMFALGLFMFAGGIDRPSPVSAAHGEQITIEVDTNPETSGGEAFGFVVTGDGDCDDTDTLEDDENFVVACAAGDVDIDVTPESGWLLDSITCSVTDDGDVDGAPNATVFSDTTATDNDVHIAIADDEHVLCIFVFIPAPVNVTIIKEAPDDTDLEFDFSVTASGTHDCEGDFALIDQGEEGLNCEEDIEYTVSEDVPTGWTLAIDCSDTGSPEIAIDEDAGEVVFTLGAGETIECTFSNEKGASTAGVPNTVTVSAAPNAVNCNSISFVSIVVKDAAGLGVADGTAVTVGTNIGSLSQTATTTTGGGGGATVIFTSPPNTGGTVTATITATSGGKTGSAPITVNCSAATAVPPTVAVAAATARPAVVSPPSTGDAGLAADGGSSWQLMAIALLVTGSLLGGLVVARRRA